MNHLIYHHLEYYHLILVYYHLVLAHHHLPILALMEKLKRRRSIENLFIKVSNVVEYLPGDINGLTKKLHLLATEFFAGNTTVRNELVHVMQALLRLKQVAREEYTDITARLAASL